MPYRRRGEAGLKKRWSSSRRGANSPSMGAAPRRSSKEIAALTATLDSHHPSRC